ncbi:MAG: diguanylate cyclase [Planctomycetia bacterium]|nr:diguanylate cyclase [Planctomycetia bacterium]
MLDQALQERLEPCDRLGRRGGRKDDHELVAAEPAHDVGVAATFLEHRRQRLQRLVEDPAAGDRRILEAITASIGIAESPGDGTDPASLIAAADEAMYRAKQAGGDRICLAAASRPTGARARESRP